MRTFFWDRKYTNENATMVFYQVALSVFVLGVNYFLTIF